MKTFHEVEATEEFHALLSAAKSWTASRLEGVDSDAARIVIGTAFDMFGGCVGDLAIGFTDGDIAAEFEKNADGTLIRRTESAAFDWHAREEA